MFQLIQRRESQYLWKTSLQNVVLLRNTYAMGVTDVPETGLFPV